MKLKDNSLFKRLLAVLATIDHPYIEKFIGAYINKTKIFLITDRTGINLSRLFENRALFPIDEGDKTILAFKVAQAISYLHSRSIMHRNLIPTNIYVGKSDEIIPKIIGFRNSRFIPKENSIEMISLSIDSKAPVSYFTAPKLEDC